MGVVKRVDEVLLRDTMGLSGAETDELHDAVQALRGRRLGREASDS
jgi:hypothetical protein